MSFWKHGAGNNCQKTHKHRLAKSSLEVKWERTGLKIQIQAVQAGSGAEDWQFWRQYSAVGTPTFQVDTDFSGEL